MTAIPFALRRVPVGRTKRPRSRFKLKAPEENETPIQDRILKALALRGIWAIRINSGGVPA